MVALLRYDGRKRGRVRMRQVLHSGVVFLAVDLPKRMGGVRWRRLARSLRKRGARRAIPVGEGPSPQRLGLVPVDPAPLCRSLAPAMTQALLAQIPLRCRRVALRGEDGRTAAALAQALCAQARTLLLDFDRGEEELARDLRGRLGIACPHLGQGEEPQMCLELAPRPTKGPCTVRLWGEPDLGGLTLTAAAPPPGTPPLAFWTVLWETGRLRAEEIAVTLDRKREKPYNTWYCEQGPQRTLKMKGDMKWQSSLS